MLLFVSLEKHHWSFILKIQERLGDFILLPNVNKGTAGGNSDSANLTDHVLFQHQRVA